MPDNIEKLYNSLVKDNYEMPSLDQFKLDMQDRNKAQRLYGNIASAYELPAFDQFFIDMNGEPVKKKEATDSGPSLPPNQNRFPWQQETQTLDQVLNDQKKSNSPFFGDGKSASPSTALPEQEKAEPDRRQDAINFLFEVSNHKEKIDGRCHSVRQHEGV
jgi:hypothetical protein